MKAFNYLLIVVFTCTISISLKSQSRSEPMVWLHMSEKVQFTPRVSGLFLFQKRFFLQQNDTYQDLFWVSGAYRLKNVRIGGGLMYFTAHKHLTSTYKSIPEFRPFQYLSHTGKVGHTRWTYQIRAMVEERFLSKVTGDEIDTGEDFQLRFRLRHNMIFQFAGNTSLKLSNEWLWANEMELVQNRAFAELGYTMRLLRMSAGYMNWYVKGIQKPLRHVWLFRLDHRIK